MAETSQRIQEKNNPFTVEPSVDNLGAGGRDVPEGQEDYYQERLRRAREDATPMPETRPRSEKGDQSQKEEGVLTGADNPEKKSKTDWDEDMEKNPESQGRVARQMHKLRQKRLEQEAKAGMTAEGKIPGVKQYKRIKNIIRAIKVVTAAGSSVGDIFVSIWVFIITAHGELIYHKVNPKYPFAQWELWFLIAVDLIILLISGILVFLIIYVYKLIENPAGALKLFS